MNKVLLVDATEELQGLSATLEGASFEIAHASLDRALDEAAAAGTMVAVAGSMYLAGEVLAALS